LDTLVADSTLTALVSRSLSAISWSGTVPTEVKLNAAARNVIERKDGNILGVIQKRGRRRNNEWEVSEGAQIAG
jgi:hypothetical protein